MLLALLALQLLIQFLAIAALPTFLGLDLLVVVLEILMEGVDLLIAHQLGIVVVKLGLWVGIEWFRVGLLIGTVLILAELSAVLVLAVLHILLWVYVMLEFVEQLLFDGLGYEELVAAILIFGLFELHPIGYVLGGFVLLWFWLNRLCIVVLL